MKRLILVAATLYLFTPARADADPAIQYAPAENLGHVDVALIDSAKREVDLAAYVLTDWPVMQALTRVADRDVRVRIYLDGSQFADREPAKVFQDLAETPGVEIRTKRDHDAPMHLKNYEIDGRLLRTGAANFSASGLKRQDNDLIVIESTDAAAAFKHNSRRDLPAAKPFRSPATIDRRPGSGSLPHTPYSGGDTPPYTNYLLNIVRY